MNQAQAIVELVDVAKRYDWPGEIEPPLVLRDINLRLAPGEALAVTGPSGSGKTTLLNIIGTLDQPTSGTVRLEGTDLSGLDDAALAKIRSRRIGWVFQLHHLLPQCTVLENVLVPALANAGGIGAETEQSARRLLERVGLGGRFDYRPGQLSGGERQRVAVVRAMINRPRLLLADEPTGALDREAAEELGKLLLELNRQEGVTLVVVTHSTELAARMPRRLELRDGMLVDGRGGQASAAGGERRA